MNFFISHLDDIIFAITGGGILWALGKKRSRWALAVGSAVAVGMAWLFWVTVFEEWPRWFSKEAPSLAEDTPRKSASESRNQSITINPPSFENVVPLDKTLQTHIHSYHVGYKVSVNFTIINIGFRSTRNIDISLWGVSDGKIIRLAHGKIEYLAENDSISSGSIDAPPDVQKVIICASYYTSDSQVEILEFFTSEMVNSTDGRMRKFRDTVSQIDNNKNICDSMPSSARRYI